MTNKKFLLAIDRACGLTWLRFQRLRDFFEDDFERAFSASQSDWKAAGIDKRGIDKFFAKTVDPDQEWEVIEKLGLQVLVNGQADFPVSLTQINPPPVLLFVKGFLKMSDTPGLAVVGSRKISDYGQSVLEAIIKPVVTTGVTTISGLALGTDRRVHEISLQAGQRTIAVLGNGLDRIYPRSHQFLAEQIIENGALISEYLPGVSPRPEFFPQRNRIISGLSKVVVLSEAASKSGTLITAAWANDQGKEIFGFPGNIFSPQSRGVNQLLAQGLATPLIEASQLDPFFTPKSHAPSVTISELSEVDQSIVKRLQQNSPLHVEVIINELSWPAAVTSAHVMTLEVKGLICNTGNQHYALAL